MTGKKSGATAAMFVAMLGLLTSPALGYILPADAILSAATARRADLEIDTLVFEGQHTAKDQAGRLWGAIQAGKTLRLQSERGDTTQVRLLKGNREWRFPLGAASARSTKVEDDLLLRFVLPTKKDSGGKRGLAFLKALKIDKETVSLGRFDGRVSYVIGAKPWEKTKPQLWIDKDWNVPVKLIYVDPKNVVRETRLIGFGSEVVAQYFPRIIELLENGEVVERFELERLEVNPAVDDDLFVPPK